MLLAVPGNLILTQQNPSLRGEDGVIRNILCFGKSSQNVHVHELLLKTLILMEMFKKRNIQRYTPLISLTAH